MPAALDRRRFLQLSGLGLSAAALAACGGPATVTQSGSTAAGVSGSAGSAASSGIDYSGVKPASEITWWSNHPGKSEDVEKALIEKFHQSQKDIKVTLVTAGANYEEVAQKFQTAQVGGELPNLVVFSDVWWFRYFLADTIAPLDPLIKQLEIDTSDYRDSLITDYQYNGQQWALPFARSTPLFYFNKAHFAAAGLGDKAPATWDEFSEWVPKLQGAGLGTQSVYQHPALAGYAGWSFQNNLWGQGGGWSSEWDITADSKQSVAAMQWLQDSVYRGKWAGVSSNDAIDDLAAGAVSATIASTGSLVGAIKAAKFDIGVGFLPGGPTEKSPVCPTGGAGIGIPKKNTPEQQLAAATFLKFLTLPENTASFSAATGYMPVRKSADMKLVVQKTPQIQVAIDQLAVTRSQDYARTFLPGADIEMANTCGKILTQQGDVATELAALKVKLTDIYTSDVKPKL
ncbi:ABC transporter substrate-binding protein [Nakamurella antarctica]|uniref:ABC transporter substrate-binding protein n=1 Tax=Nakamurella antarctica TaxID=1902245 RepID=A0A3G8ZQN7_9ACTN|nr:ABC transporter substrate-binding protein [Nakamurella antarctica]